MNVKIKLEEKFYMADNNGKDIFIQQEKKKLGENN